MKPLASKPALPLGVRQHCLGVVPSCARPAGLTYHGIDVLVLVALRQVVYAELEGLGVEQQGRDVLEHDAFLQGTLVR